MIFGGFAGTGVIRVSAFEEDSESAGGLRLFLLLREQCRVSGVVLLLTRTNAEYMTVVIILLFSLLLQYLRLTR